MPNVDYTHMTIVLDRSGSMEAVKKDTEGGFNQFIAKQKKVKGVATVTLVQFDDHYEVVQQGVTLEMLKPLVLEPRGWTALLDAIGRAIKDTGEWLKAMPEDMRPDKVLFVIITDGEENASKTFTKSQIFDMITHQREQYRWTFAFLGASQDAIKAGTGMGVPLNNNLAYANTAGGVHAMYTSINTAASNLRSGGTNSSTMEFFTEEDREAQRKARR